MISLEGGQEPSKGCCAMERREVAYNMVACSYKELKMVLWNMFFETIKKLSVGFYKEQYQSDNY